MSPGSSRTKLFREFGGIYQGKPMLPVFVCRYRPKDSATFRQAFVFGYESLFGVCQRMLFCRIASSIFSSVPKGFRSLPFHSPIEYSPLPYPANFADILTSLFGPIHRVRHNSWIEPRKFQRTSLRRISEVSGYVSVETFVLIVRFRPVRMMDELSSELSAAHFFR